MLLWLLLYNKYHGQHKLMPIEKLQLITIISFKLIPCFHGILNRRVKIIHVRFQN